MTDQIKVNRFALRSRALHCADIISDDLSSLTSSVTPAGSVSGQATAGGSTTTYPSPRFVPSRTPNSSNSPNPFNTPTSSRSPASTISGASLRPASTTSTLLSHLARQRRPLQQTPPPPLMATTVNVQQPGNGNPNSRVGPDGRNRLARASGFFSGSGTPEIGTSGNGSETGNLPAGRRLSRRASFFDRLRSVGS